MNGPLLLRSDVLCVRLERRADRYSHVFEADDGSGLRPVLESIEGTADDLWPPSPPLQDAHIEQRAGEQVALLVGRAGRSHWSMSISLAASSTTAIFDVACRTSELPRWLGSTYRLLGPPPQVTILDGLEQPLLNQTRGTLALAAVIPAVSGTQTFRWRYQLQVSLNLR